MKRKSTFLRMFALLALMLPWTLQAQNAKVSEYDYAVTTADFTSIASTGTAWTAAEMGQGYVDVPMPFGIQFGETAVASGSTLRVYGNGSVQFYGITELADSRIAPLYYSAGYTVTATSVYTKSTAQMLTVEWRKVTSGSNSYSFQLKLYATGDIEFCYGPMTISSSLSVIVGMMSSSTDIYRVGGANGTSSWDDITRYTTGANSTRTLSATYKPAYDAVTGRGMVYTFTQPACVKPNTFTATAASSSSVNLAWTVNNAGIKYEIKYSTNADFDPATEGTTQMVNDGTALSAIITGLSANTTYYFALRKYCDASTSSGWIMANATTDCAPYTAADLPIFENFDSYGTGSSATIHRCWTKTYGYNGSHTNYPYPSSSYNHSTDGSRSLYFYSSTTASYRSWVAIPYSGPMNNICVNFWIYKTSAAYGNIQVGVMSDPDDFSTFELIENAGINGSDYATSTWYNQEVYFDNYTGNGTYIVLLAPSGATNYAYVDDITISTLPACRRLSGLQVNPSGLVSWNAVSGATFEVKYATSDFTPATEGTANTVSTNSFQIPSPAGSTTYYVYVRNVCNDYWKKVTFTTPLTMPFFEDFTATTFPPSNWQKLIGLLSDAYSGTNPTSTTSGWTRYTNNYGLEAPHAKLNIYGTTYKYWLVTPNIYISGNAELTFDMALTKYGNANAVTPGSQADDKFAVLVSTDGGASWTQSNTLALWDNAGSSYVYDNIPNTGTTVVLPLTAYVGQSIMIAFYGESTVSGGDNDLHIDNISVDIHRSCAKPSDLTAANITTSGATVTWTENSGTPATQWKVKWANHTFTGDATDVDSAIVNGTAQKVLTGLTPGTTYYFMVQALCDVTNGDISAWSTVGNFTTAFGVPFSEDFTTTTFPPTGWSRLTGLVNNAFSGTNPTSYSGGWSRATTNYGLSTQPFARGNIYGSSWRHWLVTPNISIDVNAALSFDIALTGYSSSGNSAAQTTGTDDRFVVLVSTDNGATWNQSNVLREWNNSGSQYVYNDISRYGTHVIIPLTAYQGQSVMIAFYGESQTSNADNYFYIDNISIEQIVSCYPVTNVAASNVTATSVDLSWNDNNSSPDSWTIIYGAPGFNPASAGTSVTATTNPFTLSGLTAQTSYDVYVRANCVTGSDVSALSSVYNFATTCTNPCYDSIYMTDDYGDGWEGHTIDFYVNGALSAQYTLGSGSEGYALVQMCPGDQVQFRWSQNGGTMYGENNFEIYNHDDELIYTCTAEAGLSTGIVLWSGRACFTPNCHMPNQLAATSVTYTTATLDWNETTTPAPTQWVMAYQSENDVDPTYVAINTKPYTLTGLTANTNYAFAVRAVCEPGVDSSDWSSTAYFYTGYCVPNPSSVDNSGMTNLVFGDNLVVNTDTTMGLTYGDFTNLIGDAGQGTNAEVQITYGTGYTYGTHIWVDWNNDLDFDDDGELVYTGLSESTNPTTLAASFTVPANATLGDYRMRVGGSDDDLGPDPCYTGSWACLFDFTLRVTQAPTCYKPTALAATNVYGKQATLNWNENTPTAATNWQLCYTANGETTYKYVNTNNNYLLTGLTPETDYTNVMVRAICGDGDTSNWSAPINFTTTVACFVPTGLTGSALVNKVTLSWNENTLPTAATRWEVAYGANGFDPDDETQATYIETTNRTNFEITGLHHSRKYQFYVRALCGEDGYSDWSNVVTLETPCGAWSYADMPLIENFDGVTGTTTTTTNILPNSCWRRINTGTTYTGMPQVYNSSTYAVSGTNSFKFYVGTTTAYADQYAVLPEMGFDLDTIAIELSARFSNATSEITIGVMADPEDVSTFVPVTTISAPSTGYSTYATYTADLQEYTGTARYIALAAIKSSAVNGFYIDDLQVKLREKVNTLSNNGGTLAICNEVVIPDTVNANYGNNINATYVINPGEAGKVVHLTGTYNLENGYDFLKVYEGVGSGRTLVGTYTGNGSIDFMSTNTDWVNHGSVTLVFTTDADNAFAHTGFKLLAQCECPQPVADTVYPVVEANGTYTWINGVTYTNNSTTANADDLVRTVFYTQPNVGGCDSVYYVLDLTVHPTYNLTSSATICERDSVVFYGQTFKTTGTYNVTLASQYGADSVGVLNLQVNPAPTAGIYNGGNEVTNITGFCDNADLTLLARSNDNSATFAWEDNSTAATRVVNPHESNTYTVIATNPTTGCTSLPATLTVTTTPVAALSISGNNVICAGQSTTLTLTDANNVDANYRWSTGATTPSITVSPAQTTTYNVRATTNNTSACVTTAEVTVTVNPLPVVTATASVASTCTDSAIVLTATEVEGYNYSWNTGATTAIANTAATSTMAYTVTVTDQNGCVNEFNTATVTVYPSYELTDSLNVCYLNNPYTWGAQQLTANGNYDQKFAIAHGCDSLVHLAFTFEQMGIQNSNIERCYGDSYTFENITRIATVDTALTYTLNVGDVDPNGDTLECPVRYNLTVKVNPVKATTIEQTVCDTYTWPVSGETYTVSGAYPVTLATTKNCDSVVTLNLTVNYQNTGDTTVVACDNYEWRLNGVNYTASTETPTFTLQNEYGCDSTVTLHLTINNRTYHEDFHCVRDANSFLWDNGTTYTLNVDIADSIQYVTGTNEVGCKEIALLNLVLNPVINVLNWANVEVCDEYEVANAVVFTDENDCQGHIEPLYLSESGDYEIRTREDANNYGQDKTTRIHLTVNTSSHHTTIETACLPYTWEVNIGSDTMPVMYPVATITEEMVNGASVYNMSYEMPQEYSNGCSDIRILRLTPKYPTVVVDTVVTICDNQSWTAENSVVFSGNVYNTGIYTWSDSEVNTDGCPMTRKVDLTVNPTYNETAELTFCESDFTNDTLIVVNANNATESIALTIPGALNENVHNNTVVANWTTATGCDSIVTITYTVNPTITETETQTVCYSDHFVWDVNNETYAEAGVYNESVDLQNPTTGCKLVKELNLTVIGTSYGDTTIAVCTSYEYNGVTYRETRTFDVPYEGTNTIVNGCDSVTHVTYEIHQAALNHQYVVSNRPYTWKNGQTFSQSVENVYFDVPVAEGCDSVLSLHFTMVDPIVLCDDAFPYATGINGITLEDGNRVVDTASFCLNNPHAGNVGGVTDCYWGTKFNASRTADWYNVQGANLYYVNNYPGTYTLNIYAGGDNAPNTLVGSKTITFDANEATGWKYFQLDQPIVSDGQNLWVTFEGHNLGYPISVVQYYDENDQNGAWVSTNGTTWESLNDNNNTLFYSFMIKTVYSANMWRNNDPQGNDTILYYTVNKTYNTTATVDTCDSYTWEGTTYTSTGNYTANYTSAEGCDSVMNLNLTIRNSSASTVNVAVCDSYTWAAAEGGNDSVFTVSGTHYNTITNFAGCDSVLTLNLTINKNNGGEETLAACDSLIWNRTGLTYKVSGDYTKNFADANGCLGDSVLHLTINPSYETNSEIIINEAGSYTYLGVMYSSDNGAIDTTITHTFQSVNGCDSIDHLRIVIPVMDDIVEIPVEACGTYTWAVADGGTGHTYKWIPMSERQSHGMAMYKDVTANKYVYTYPTDTTFTNGVMTQVRVLHLNLLESTTSVDTLNIPVSLATYTIYGLDSVAVETFNFTYADRGTSFDTTIAVGSVAYCEDYRTYTINYIDNYDTTEYYVCADATTYEWGTESYTVGTPGHTYFFAQKENEGTMTELVHVRKVNQRAVNAETITETACDSYVWTSGDSLTYTSSVSGVVYNYTDANGCAATKTLNLTVKHNTSKGITEDVCDTYTWTTGNGNTYTASGDYTYNYTDSNSCAATDTLHLIIRVNSNQGYTAAACNSYVWERDGQTYTTSGDKTYSYNATNGCPSVDTLHLTINLPSNTSTTLEACDSTLWNDTMYYVSGTYFYNYNTAAGCASTDTLYLTVNAATHNAETKVQCDSYDWNGTTYTENGTYTYSYTNVAGCASVDTLYLTINVNNDTRHDTIVACDEYVWDVNARPYTTSGDYTARTNDTINGCPTTNTLNLTINHTSSYDSVLYISDGSYRYYGQNATELFGEGVYNRSELYTNAAGCDSTLNITFNVGTAQLGIDNVVNCNEYTWRNGETYVWISDAERAAHLNADNDAPLYKTSTGTYIYYNPTFTVPQNNAYDSVYMLALTLTQSALGTDEVTMNISDRQITYGDSTFHFDASADSLQNFIARDVEFDVHFAAVQHCDSIITLTVHLVNNYQEVTADAADICVTTDSYTWRGHTINTTTQEYDDPHTYYVYDTLATGTIEYITVTQHPITYVTERRTACDSYTWYGTEYTESTTNATKYFAAGDTLNGTVLVCDRVVTLILNIRKSTDSVLTTAACNSFTWNGTEYTESTDVVVDGLTNAAGCDSTATLHLTINYPTDAEYTVDVCDIYTWTVEEGGDDRVLTATGDYTYNYNSTVGNCPSVNTLHLTIRNNSDQTITKTVCDTYTWTAEDKGDGETYTTSGTYYYDYEAENGCPSTNTLNLTVNVNSGHTDAIVACDSIEWHDTWYYADNNTATYDYVDANNCPSVDVLNLTINNATHNSETVVACQTYTWHGNVINNPSSVGDMLKQDYTYNYTNDANCPSVDTLHLTLGGGRTFGTETVTNCGPYTWVVNDEEVGVLSESVQTSTSFLNPRTGCDSVVFLYLTINEAPMTDVAATICDSELPYTWTDGDSTLVLTEAGQATVTYPFSANCDSTVRLTLTVNQVKATALTDQICLGNGYNANGFIIAATEMPAAGEYTFTQNLTSAQNCDSIVTLTLTVGDVISNPVEAVACDSYVWNAGDGETYNFTESGTYNSEAYANTAGCTTVDVLTLTINVNAGTEYTETVCDAYMWNGTQYTETGDYTYDYIDGNNCASTDVLHLTVNNSVINNITKTVCDSYTWTEGNGETYTTSGVYTYNYTTTDGCNGTDYLVLTINTNSSTEYTATACDSYVWDINGETYTESGDITYDYTDANGCASTDVLHLTVNQNSNTEYTETACDSYNWYNTVYNVSGDYTYEYINNKGCASTDVLHLTINNSAVITIDTAVCGWFDWNGISYNDSDVITHGFTAANGCDSTEIINLTVNNAQQSTVTATACDSYTWDVNGNTYTEGGMDVAILNGASANGCDSLITLVLTLNHNTNSSETVTACDNYTWNGQTYTTTGTQTYAYTAANGCASVDTLHLTINNSTTSEETAEACNYYLWNGNAYTQSGNYTYVSTNADGCNNTATLHLTINTQVTNTITATACNSYTWNGAVYTATGNYTQNFSSAAGCDSIVTLALTINPAVTNTVSATACNSYTWNGQTYTTSGNYTGTFTATNGCDSIVTMNLTINTPVTNTVNAAACDSYTWNGTAYTTSGSYTATATAANGCDSITTLNLVINNSTTNAISATACNSYTWNGATYTTTGTYTQTFTTVAGCDSVVTLALAISPAVQTTVNETTCNSYTWNGTTYTTSGNYTHTYTTTEGCDSVVTLNLTVNPAVNMTVMATACDSYTWDGQDYTTTGNYTNTYTASNGCDSIVTLMLTVNHSTFDTVDIAICDGVEWEGHYYDQSGTYTYVTTTMLGCDSNIIVNLTVNHSVEIYDTIDILETQLPYNYYGNNITAEGDYVFNGTTVHGCDSSVYLHVNVEPVAIDVVSSLDNVSVYPNPTRGRLTVSAENVVKVEVLDIVGRKVATFENTNTFDISNLGEGAYTLRITLPEGITVRKVVKK